MARARRPILRVRAWPQFAMRAIFDGKPVLATMTGMIPWATGGVPRTWVRIDGERVGPFYPATLFRWWGARTQPVLASGVTIRDGRLVATVWER